MFQFPGFAFIPYGFRNEYLLLISASPKIAEPPRRPQPFGSRPPKPKPGRRPASAHPECASRSTSTDRLFGITEIEGGFPHSEILRIKACSRLPETYRSVPRPSSPLSAKASTRYPYDT